LSRIAVVLLRAEVHEERLASVLLWVEVDEERLSLHPSATRR
jgi:hypothetical protein